jgi:hypothetical protein
MEIDIRHVLKNKKNWRREFDEVYQYFKDNIGDDGCFEKKVDIELHDGAVVRMGINNYLTNLIMWRPSIRYRVPITINNIFDTSCITSDQIKDYLDNVYIRPFRNKVDLDRLNTENAIVIEKCKKIVEDFGLIMCITYNLHTINKLRKENKEIDDILHTKIPKGMQPKEIEDFALIRRKRLIKLLGETDTGFAPLLNSREGFKEGQLQEFLVVVGPKPSLAGDTMAVPINTNILVGGLDTPAHYTLDAKGGRKALIFNKKYTGNSGYFSRKLSLLCLDIKINNVEDCHTDQYLKIHVDSKETLRRLEGKYYKSVLSKRYIRAIKPTDVHLIDTTIYLRSAAKCKCKDGICHRCYGDLAKIVEEINAGIFAATHISSRFTQNILSAKHLLMTNSKKIELCDEFDKYFTLEGNVVTFDSNNIDDDLSNLFIRIHEDDLNVNLDEYSLDNHIASDDDDNDNDYTTVEELTCDKFDIVTEEGEVIDTIFCKNNMVMNISDYLYEMIERYGKNRRSVMIPMDNIEDEEGLFSIDVNNAELTKTLNLVKDLLEKEDHLGCKTIDELIEKLNLLLIEGKIYANMVHCEVLCKNLMRSIHKIDKYPDLAAGEEYQLLTVKKALMSHPSPIVSLSFERIKEQIKGTLLFRKRGSSLLDGLFRETYMRHYDMKKEDLAS